MIFVNIFVNILYQDNWSEVINIFSVAFLKKNVTLLYSLHVLGIRRSVLHLVYTVGLASSFAMVSSPAFDVRPNLIFPRIFLIILFSSNLLPLPMPLLVLRKR